MPQEAAWKLSSVLVLAVALGACASSTPARRQAPPTAAEVAPRTLPVALHWVRSSAEYRAALYQAYRAATERLEQEAGKRQPGTWAVALDADETVINNSGYQKERMRLGKGFTPESWAAWVHREESPPLPGAVAFLQRVRELGGKIAIVTNRDEKLCPATEADFGKHGIPFDVMLCKPPGQSRKEPRWQSVENGTAAADLPPLAIVLWVGDNIRDFPHLDQDIRKEGPEAFADFGVRFFLIPNPLYGSWQDNPAE